MATSSTRAVPDSWTLHVEHLAGLALVAGCLLPLSKSSLLFGSSDLVWPWQLAGKARSVAMHAALATPAGGDNLILWVVLPLFAGLGSLAIARSPSRRTRGLASLACGAGMLGIFLLVLIPENAVLGLVFVPPTRAAGALMFTGIVAGAFLAAANHGTKTAANAGAPRVLVAAAAAFLIALSGGFLLGAGGVWAAWPLRLLYVLVLAYAGLAVGQLGRANDPVRLAAWSSFLVRAILVWSSVAVVLAQRIGGDDFVIFVVEAAGGPGQTVLAVLKGFLIFAGGGLLLAAGFAAVLEARRSPAVPRTR